MNKPKEFTVSISKKIGQPNFSSLSLLASITYETDGKDLARAYEEAWDEVKQQIRIQEDLMGDPNWISDKTGAGKNSKGGEQRGTMAKKQ